jgi:hypothetical protein
LIRFYFSSKNYFLNMFFRVSIGTQRTRTLIRNSNRSVQTLSINLDGAESEGEDIVLLKADSAR